MSMSPPPTHTDHSLTDRALLTPQVAKMGLLIKATLAEGTLAREYVAIKVGRRRRRN